MDSLNKGSVVVTDGVATGTSNQFKQAFDYPDGLLPNFPFKPNTAYLFSADVKYEESTSTSYGLNIRALYTDGTYENMKRVPLNTPDYVRVDGVSNSNKTLKAIYCAYNSGANNQLWMKNVQIEEASQATAYEPYNGQTATIALPHTVYGSEHDVLSGVGSEEWGMIKLSDLDWTGIASNPPVFRAVLSSIPNIQAPASNTTVTTAFTESFSAMSYTAISSSNIGKFAVSATVSNRVVFIDDSVATLDEFLAKYGNDKLVYPLATPTTYQATPAQLNARNGANNVWADAGQMSEIGFAVHQQYIGR